MSSLRKIQLFALAVIINCVAAMALMAPKDAHANPCGMRYDCTALNCHNPFWAQNACAANLPPQCVMTTPVACYDAGSTSCPFMVLCQDQ